MKRGIWKNLCIKFLETGVRVPYHVYIYIYIHIYIWMHMYVGAVASPCRMLYLLVWDITKCNECPPWTLTVLVQFCLLGVLHYKSIPHNILAQGGIHCICVFAFYVFPSLLIPLWLNRNRFQGSQLYPSAVQSSICIRASFPDSFQSIRASEHPPHGHFGRSVIRYVSSFTFVSHACVAH